MFCKNIKDKGELKNFKMNIQLSEHFTYKKLIKFTIPTIFIMIFLMSAIFGINGIWLAVTVAESLSFIVCIIFIITNKKKYGYA